jgi:serine/threonine protein phosphatase PrpC
MRFLPGNAQHIGARHSQQDSFGFNDPDDTAFIQHGGFLAIVCDGMGGMEHGDLAGRTGVRTFLDAYSRKTPQESVPAALDRSVREANARVVALAHSLGRAEGVGTTLVAAALLDGGPGLARLYWVSVGDSGLFHVGGGQMRMVNRPHVFANQLDQAVARGTLSLEAAMTHPERESLTSYIGAEVLEEIDLTPEPLVLAEGDTILLASDGMFKTLSPAEITACLSGHPQNWPDTLVHETLARRKEGQDNVTVLSVTVAEEPVSASPSGTFVRLGGSAAAPTFEFNPAQQLARTVQTPQDPAPPMPAALPMSAPPVPPPAPHAPMVAPQAGFAPPPGPPALGATDMVKTADRPVWPQPGMAPAMAQTMPPGMTSAAPAPPRSGGLTWILILLLLAGAGGGGYWYWSHRAPSAASPIRRRTPPANQTPPVAPTLDPNRPIPPLDPNAPATPLRQPEVKQPPTQSGDTK